MMMMDASYDFGYTADASSRAESADPAGNVVGTYAYTSPDGNQLEVRIERSLLYIMGHPISRDVL